MRIFRPILILIVSLSAIIGVHAQGNGPTQPEVSTFTPAGTSDMVDPATGDFNYSIPLFDVGGYPVTISYNAGRSMDEQASSVGLGWNLNIGQVTRNMRGIPDDFMGDEIKRTVNLRDNVTVGIGAGVGVKFKVFSWPLPITLTRSLNFRYNTYNGFAIKSSNDLGYALHKDTKRGMSIGLSLSNDTQEGTSLGASLSLDGRDNKWSTGLGISFSSREGLDNIHLKGGFNWKKELSITKNGVTSKGSVDRKLSSNMAYNFAGSDYTPYSDLRMASVNVMGSFNPGVTLFNLSNSLSFNGYYRNHFLADSDQSKRGYGAIYHHNASEADLVDVNREKDGSISNLRKNMAIPTFTSDIFSVTGHGFSGSFQIRRGEVPEVFDAHIEDVSTGASVSVDLQPGNIVDVGLGVRVPITLSESGGYNYVRGKTSLESGARVLTADETSLMYERYYYKFSGEMVVGDPDFYKAMGGVDLVNNKFIGESPSAFFNTVIKPPYGLRRNQREVRNNVVYHLTAGEAQTLGLQKKILNYTKNGVEEIERVSGDRQAHHISEITALKEGGIRYVFGLPAYNISQSSTTYNTNTTVLTVASEGLIDINPIENSIRNGSGLDNFYEQTVIPAYAHSFLLTAVLSPDYQDRTGDGPTPDDFGSYTRFNYTRVYDNFKWQTPETPNKAEFHHGLYGKTNDNKATYIEGIKEVWYIHSIESKEYVAEFNYGNREDVISDPVMGERKNAHKPLQRLESIQVFSLVERRANASTAIPLKRVDFGFDYSLYPNTPTGLGVSSPGVNMTGVQRSPKLTLKTLAFSSENSDKGRFSPYKFDYYPSPDYNRLAHNDWGAYKPATTASAFPVLQRKDFPYIDQTNPALEDDNVEMGNLRAITLPSGGKITVTYEADDYAYVQDKPAMNFFPILGFVRAAGDNNVTNRLCDGLFLENNNNFVVMQLPSSNITTEIFKRDYLKNNLLSGSIQEYVLLKTYTRLGKRAGGGPDIWDWLDTYAKINGDGVSVINGKAYIPLIEENTSNGILPYPVNPIRKSALNFVKSAYSLELNDRLNHGSFTNISINVIQTLFADFANMSSLLFGTNNVLLRTQAVGERIQLPSTTVPTAFIRLTTPTGIKKGGGLRVHAIQIDDNFKNMTGLDNSVYRTAYDYKIEEEKGKPISSGVASYEPLVGGQENPWRQPEFEENNNFGRVNERKFMEMPFAESYFPAPNIIYRKVTVRSVPVTPLTAKKPEKHRPGYTVHEFFTAKEFPTIVKKTVATSSRYYMPLIPLEPYFSTSTDRIAYSQGYSIELNDMHGKPKQVTSYSNNNDVTSFTSYKYKTTADNKLDNNVSIVQKNKMVSTKSLGLDIEQVIDYRRSKNITTEPGGYADVDFSFYPPFVVIPGGAAFPTFAYHETNFESATNIKVIRRSGILESVTAMDLGSTVVTKNLAFDGETGAVLLTETQNEFNDPIYNLTIPAHWAYKEMGFAYKNIQGVLPGINGFIDITNGQVNKSAISGDVIPFLCKGDVLAFGRVFVKSDPYVKYWVTDVTPNSFTVVDEKGDAPTGRFLDAKIIQSGFKNMQSMPVQTITSLQNPIQNNVLVLNTTKVVDSKAMEYGDAWSPFCTDCGVIPEGTNSYRRNRLGQWRQLKTFAFATDRQSNLAENNTTTPKVNLRRDGIYAAFSPYWDYAGTGAYWTPTGPVLKHDQGGNNAWVEANAITKYDHDGNLIESKNALEIYQAQLSGYLNRKTTAVSNNAKYNEIFFDGFEDYNYNLLNGNLKNCGRHFLSKNIVWDKLSNTYPNLSKEEAHTGKYALKVTSEPIEFSVEKPCLEEIQPAPVLPPVVLPPGGGGCGCTVDRDYGQTDGLNGCEYCEFFFSDGSSSYATNCSGQPVGVSLLATDLKCVIGLMCRKYAYVYNQPGFGLPTWQQVKTDEWKSSCINGVFKGE